ncbi:cytochrome P450 [Amycolatopsis sp. K13G38]|uniref:Cytochrome P450 n=1 Tax=Amycolatopsis acididurans TaxID=2724524 RepID=A0ABX1J3E6_9PSEU|nr:cytochrome P450 [Amycolatopsis acididurans]NKQ54293.1 cytochrome P450 [Amycolatopsis acididurans]
MTIAHQADETYRIPDHIVQAAIDPDSYLDFEGRVLPAYAWLREHNPLGRAELAGHDPVWLVTKLADLRFIERHTDLFTVTQDNIILDSRASDAFMRSLTGGSSRILDAIPYLDPPEHTKVRAVAHEPFLPRNVAKLESQIRELARATVERVLATEGELDLVADLALGYPLHVIMTLLGVPEKDEPLMLRLTQEFFGAQDDERGAGAAENPEEVGKAFIEAAMSIFGYFSELNADRRACPRNDLVSLIANSRIDGEPIGEGYANGWYLAIAAGGHDTTASTISSTLLALAQRPDQLARVKADLDLIPQLVEEGLRWTTPAKHFMRTATQDLELRGRQIKKGDRLMLLWASGNHDEEVFDNPQAFDIGRTTKHIAFGSGAHTCVGMHLAKLELRILFEELLPRIGGIEIVGRPQWVRTNFVGGLKRLPARLLPDVASEQSSANGPQGAVG